ncbi:MAG: glycosyltransferase family 9 protein [bacterium]
MERYSNGKPKLILNPRIGQGKRFWPASRVGDLLQKCRQDFGFEIWIIAGPQDRDYVEEISEHMGGERPHTISLLDLDQLGAILKPCGLFIGPDSGTSRLAASLGVPTVVLFGTTRPSQWGAPPTAQIEVISKDARCSPCSIPQKLACQTRHCFMDISIEEVIGKVKKLIGYGQEN